MPLILNLQTKPLELSNDAQQLHIRITNEDAIVYKDNEDGVATIVDTIVYQRLDETYLQELGGQIMIPHPTCLFPTINVPEEHEDVILGVTMFCLNALRQLHVHVHLDGCLRERHDKVKFPHGLLEEDGKHNY